MSLSRTVDRLLGLTLWGTVVASRALAGKLGKVWVRSFGVDSELDHWQPYGFQSRPQPGAEAIILSMGSHPGERIALLVGDRRYTIALEAGDVVLVDFRGNRVLLGPDGIALGDGTTLIAADGVLTGQAIDPFTGSTHFVLGNASALVRAKK